MRIMAVDPGLTRCGAAVIDAANPLLPILATVRVITSPAEQEFSARIGLIGRALDEMMERFAPNVVAVEKVFAQHNLSTVTGVAGIIGVVSYLADQRKIAVVSHTPSEVKAAICGYGNANKEQVRHMVSRIFKDQPLPSAYDASDALALAVCSARRGRLTEAATAAQQAWRAALEKQSRA